MLLEQRTPHPLRLDVESVGLTDEQFYRLCQDNPELRIELTANRELVIMSPTGSKTRWRNSRLNQRLANWAEQDGTGLSFDSSTGFTLPNGAKRSPDASWVRRAIWEALSEEEQEGFAPLCPDFVVELRSLGDDLSTLQNKMAEYIANGARLGWLLDPRHRRVYVYRPGQPVEHQDDPATIHGDPVLRGFVFQIRELW
ncbi:MAG: Uma2 family endonuclease [Ardenticatenaceae bacterium]